MLLQHLDSKKFAAVIAEAVLLLGCILLDVNQAGPDAANATYSGTGIFKAAAVAAAFQMCLHLMDVYDFRSQVPNSEFLKRLGLGLLIAGAVVSGLYAVAPAMRIGQPSLLVILLRVSSFLVVWHLLLRIYFRVWRRRSNVLVLGTNSFARTLVGEILRRSELGLKVIGFIDEDPNLLGESIVNPKVIGLTGELLQIASRRNVDQVVVSLEDRRGALPLDELLTLKSRGVKIDEATSVYERLTGRIAIDNLKPSWLVFGDGFRVSRMTALHQRILSVGAATVLFVLFLPVASLIALLVKLDSQGPVFFGQERVGRDGRSFILWKFRSMREDAERNTGPTWASRADDRVTRVGRFLRRTRMDELPQLYNVLKGDMSLVGPRPERPYFVRALTERIPFYDLRHAVRPGITGWAQINYRYGSSTEDAIVKAQYDLFYIKNMSLSFDALILLNTIRTVLRLKGA